MTRKDTRSIPKASCYSSLRRCVHHEHLDPDGSPNSTPGRSKTHFRQKSWTRYGVGTRSRRLKSAQGAIERSEVAFRCTMRPSAKRNSSNHIKIYIHVDVLADAFCIYGHSIQPVQHDIPSETNTILPNPKPCSASYCVSHLPRQDQRRQVVYLMHKNATDLLHTGLTCPASF